MSDLTARLGDLYQEAATADQTGEDLIPPAFLADLTPEQLFELVASAEREARRWRTIKRLAEQAMADTLEGRQVRYGDTLYRSRRKTVRTIPTDVRFDFAWWVAEGGSERVTKLFNPNSVRFGQLRDEEWVDADTGEILSAFDAFVEEVSGEDAPWTLEAIPVTRLKFAQSMPEGEVRGG